MVTSFEMRKDSEQINNNTIRFLPDVLLSREPVQVASSCAIAGLIHLAAPPSSQFLGFFWQNYGGWSTLFCIYVTDSAHYCLSLHPYHLVWATELSLAAIGLVFPALVLGYKSFNCLMYQVPVPTLIDKFV